MRKKRIVIIGNSLSPHVFNRLSRFSKAADLEFSLFDTNLNSEVEVPIQRISNKIPRALNIPIFKTIFKLLRSVINLQRARPDTIFIMYCSSLSLLYSILFRGNVVLSFWGSDLLKRSTKEKGSIKAYIQKKALLKADRIYCVSKELVDEVYVVAGTKLAKKPVLLMYGLDLEKFNSPETKIVNVDACFTIYSPRWCLPLYNIEAIIEAVILLLQAGQKVRLIYRDIYIDNNIEATLYSAKLTEKIKNSGFKNNFETRGLSDNSELMDLIRNADLVISVSHYDGTPLSILEAMALRTLTVSGKIPSTMNFITHGENGYLVNKDEPKEIAQQITRIMNDQNAQNKVIENARLFVEQNADLDLEVKKYINSFHEI